jgi:hypothetical protein
MQKKDILNFWDKTMMAITFAEAGEADTARDILNQKQQRPALRVRKEAVRRPELRV